VRSHGHRGAGHLKKGAAGPRRRMLTTRSTRAAVLRKPGGPLEIRQLQLDGTRDDELLVRLAASVIPTSTSARSD
jgi:hypothetical protein